jgi:allantoate deiminase
MTDPSLALHARLLARWLDELGRVSDERDRLTRTFLSPAMEQANALVGGWMRGAGLAVREDGTGNIIGRLEGPPGAKTLLLGSHLDTVRNAGRFDGALGVLLPIVALAELRQRGAVLPFAVEVLGFSEEEAVRFSGAYLGSKAYTGRLRAADLALRDARGNTLRAVVEAHLGTGKKFTPPARAHAPGELLGYLEVHIEQGPVLEAEKLSVGVVSAIAAQRRGRLTFRGKAGHAGTTPMRLRRDALAGAAEFVLAAEKFARGQAQLVATVGTISVVAGAANVIPGETVLSLDLRHPRDAPCRAAWTRLLALAKQVARRRGLTVQCQPTMNHRAVACSPALSALLTQSVRAVQKRSLTLVSGAGHDAVVLSSLTPVTMLFVRCRGGLSHHPDEFTAPADLRVALEVVVDFLERLAKRESR